MRKVNRQLLFSTDELWYSLLLVVELVFVLCRSKVTYGGGSYNVDINIWQRILKTNSALKF